MDAEASKVLDQLKLSVDPASFGGGAQYSFLARRFDKEIVGVQPFSGKSEFTFPVSRPGFYRIEGAIKVDGKEASVASRFKYVPPAKSVDLDSQGGKEIFTRAIARSLRQLDPAAFLASIGSQVFDFLFFPAKSRKLYVLCPSAIIRGQFPVPYFYRWLWAANGVFPGNVIVVSDPTFNIHPELNAGWMVGTREMDATRNFARILGVFLKEMKISPNYMTFWGSSAGGFIAAQLAAYFPGSAALAVNAQTDIAKYPDCGKLFKYGFPGMKDDEIREKFSARLSLIANLPKLRRSRLFIVQNTQDAHHYSEHFLPFMNALAPGFSPEAGSGIQRIPGTNSFAWLYSHPDGHMAETLEMSEAIISRLSLSR